MEPFWYNFLPMTSTALAPSAASRGGVGLFGRRQRYGKDLLAVLVLLAVTSLGLMAGYAHSTEFTVGIAGYSDKHHLQAFYEPEALAGQQTLSYRWTEERSMIVAPGLGRGLWQTLLTLSSPQPVGKPKRVVIEAGADPWAFQLSSEPRVFHLLTP